MTRPLLVFFLGLSSLCLHAQNDPVQVAEEIVDIEAKLIEASGLAVQGDNEAAIKLYEELLAEDPSNSAASYSAARLYNSIDSEKALKLMQQAYRHDALNAYVAQALADMLTESDRYLQASEIYGQLFKRYPKREEFLLEQTQSLSRGGKPREGLRAIEQYLSSGGRLTPYIGQQRFTLAVSMNDPKAAIRSLEELMAAHPDNPEYYQELAQFYRRTGDEASAKQIWSMMADKFPEDKRSALGLAGQSKLTNEEDKFITRLEPIFEDPTLDIDSKILQLMPIVQEVANRNDTVLANRTLTLAETLTEVHSDEPKSFAIYGDLLFYAKKTPQAVAAYRKTLELDPNVYLVWEQLLLALAESGEYEQLLAESENALTLFPNQARLYYYSGRALAKAGDLTGAENTLMQGTVMALNDQVLLYDLNEALARVQLSEGRFEAALTSASAAHKIRPKHGPALALKAEVYLRQDDMEMASKLLSQATSEAPQHPYVITIEALAQLLAAEVSRAEKSMLSATEYGAARWAIAQEVNGDIAFLKGEEASAKTYWELAKSMGGGSSKLAEKLSKGVYVK
ncbi:MAG: tetratricopeptide repeat protein [Saprospiraceae bacterium]